MVKHDFCDSNRITDVRDLLYVATGFGETGYIGWGFPTRIPHIRV